MLISKLVEYYDSRSRNAPRYYWTRPISYIVELDVKGRFVGLTPTSTEQEPFGTRIMVPASRADGQVLPMLLADGADYTFSIQVKNTDPASRHEAYLGLLEECIDATNEESVITVYNFLIGKEAKKAVSQLQSEGVSKEDRIAFRVDGEYAHDLPAVQRFWAEYVERTLPVEVKQCGICGQPGQLIDKMQWTVKGIKDPSPQGPSLISAKGDCLSSYGLEGSEISPICPGCAHKSLNSINEMTGSATNRIKAADSVAIFWTRQESGFNLLSFTDNPKPEDVRDLIDSARSGKPQPTLDNNKFYAAWLTGRGRLVVESYLEETVAEVQEHLATWFEQQQIVDFNGGPHMPQGLYWLAKSTVRDGEKHHKSIYQSLLASALEGRKIAPKVISQALYRCHVEKNVTRSRAGLMKLALLRMGTEVKMGLDENNAEPAYLCGRLMAVLESIQYKAMPKVNTSIVDKYYARASVMPKAVVPGLLRGAKNHLKVIRRENGAAYSRLSRQLEEIVSQLSTNVPARLNQSGQLLFQLGYYQQQADSRRKYEEYKLSQEQNNSDEAVA